MINIWWCITCGTLVVSLGFEKAPPGTVAAFSESPPFPFAGKPSALEADQPKHPQSPGLSEPDPQSAGETTPPQGAQLGTSENLQHQENQDSPSFGNRPGLLVVPAVVARLHVSKTIAQPVVVCQFDERCDRDYDGWPDEWFRERSREFPRHPIVRIVHRGQSAPETPSKNGSKFSSSGVDATASQLYSPPPLSGLLIRPEGGGVSIARPVSFSPSVDYLLRVEFEVRDLVGGFLIELETHDPAGQFRPQKVSRLFLFGEPKRPPNLREGIERTNQPVQSEGNDVSAQSPGLEAWLHLKVDPRKKVDSQGVLRLRVYPSSRSRREGEVWIRSVTLWQIPHVETKLLPASQIAPLGTPIEGKICTHVVTPETGFPQPAQGEVILQDRKGDTVTRISLTSDKRSAGEEAPRNPSKYLKESEGNPPEASPAESLAEEHNQPIPEGVAGASEGNPESQEWAFQFLPPKPGYYRVLIRLLNPAGQLIREEIWPLAVLLNLNPKETLIRKVPLPSGVHSRSDSFESWSRVLGWSISPHTLIHWGGNLADVLPESGIGLLRWEAGEPGSFVFPRWNASEGMQTILKSCRTAGISFGILLSRPASPHEEFSQRWGKHLEVFPAEVLSQMHWLQLGYEANPLCSSQQEAEAEFLRLSHGLTAELPIRQAIIPFGEKLPDQKDDRADPQKSFPPHLRVETCRVANWQDTKPKGDSEETTTLRGNPSGGGIFAHAGSLPRSLASIRITPSEDAPTSELAAKLVQGICQAAAADSSWILLSLDETLLSSLCSPTGGPGELFLPWWISTELLREAKPVGLLPVGPQATGWLFSRKGEGLVVFWSKDPGSIPLTLPHGGRVIDPWGQVEEISPEGDPTFLPVGPLPKFILCQDFWALAWQKDCRFEPSQLLPYPGTAQSLKIQFTNPADFPVRGTLLVSGPPGFRIHPFEFRYHLGPKEIFASTLQITAPSHAFEGGHTVRWLFRFEEPENITMAIDRPIELRWPGLEFGSCQLVSNPPAKVFQVDMYNKTGGDLHVILELFGLNRKRAALPPQVFLPGHHQIRIPLEDGGQESEERFILQVREVNGPRRIRVEMKPTR
jgi:hypothetical protein